MNEMRIFRNLNMRLIKGLLLALASTTVMHGMDELPDGGVERAAGPLRVVTVGDGTNRSDTPCIRDVLFGEEISGILMNLFSRISLHSKGVVNIVISGLNAEGGVLDISVATEIKRRIAEYEVSMAGDVSGLGKDIETALARLGIMLDPE